MVAFMPQKYRIGRHVWVTVGDLTTACSTAPLDLVIECGGDPYLVSQRQYICTTAGTGWDPPKPAERVKPKKKKKRPVEECKFRRKQNHWWK